MKAVSFQFPEGHRFVGPPPAVGHFADVSHSRRNAGPALRKRRPYGIGATRPDRALSL